MPTYDIIIPSWNQKQYVVPCLNSIKRYSKDYRVIFVDNNSHIDEFKEADSILQTMPHWIIRNNKNLGYVKAINQGLKVSTAPFIVLMNNDAEAVPGWLAFLRKGFEFPKVLIAGPTTDKVCWQKANLFKQVKQKVLVLEDGFLAFFCVMLKRKVIDICGYLDEDFGVGMGDDHWYCWKVQQKGYKLALITDLRIPHRQKATFHALYGKGKTRQLIKQGQNLCRAKILLTKRIYL